LLKSTQGGKRLVAEIASLTYVLNERDGYTGKHCLRVRKMAVELGKLCSLSAHDLTLLRTAAGLHDIGKIDIPDRILLKAGKLDPDEWEIMKTHSARSQAICLAVNLEDMDKVGMVTRHHHERFDGQGYPDGLSGEAIPALSRIIAIADSYDAMSTPRPYRSAIPHQVIMDELMQDNGCMYDPYILGRFCEAIEGSNYRVA
jgi:HD-GYP domain-containing protein (c-di-GMP phosphodiesterase class II)